VGRRGLRRLLDAAVFERLALIALARASGFTLEEIARVFAPDGRPRIDRPMLAAKANELDRTIRKLKAMRDGLRHAAACRAHSHMQCPTFRRLLAARFGGDPAAADEGSEAAALSFQRRCLSLCRFQSRDALSLATNVVR
jgi:DNA-binding transcriptional MerR regulator